MLQSKSRLSPYYNNYYSGQCSTVINLLKNYNITTQCVRVYSYLYDKITIKITTE